MTGIDLPTGLDSIRPWLSTGGICGLLAICLKFYLDNRRLGLEARKELHKLKLEDNSDERAGYGALIKAMREDLEIVRDNHRNCETRLASVEARAHSLEAELNGVHKQIISLSAREAVQIPASPTIVRAAESAMRHAAGNGTEKPE